MSCSDTYSQYPEFQRVRVRVSCQPCISKGHVNVTHEKFCLESRFVKLLWKIFSHLPKVLSDSTFQKAESFSGKLFWKVNFTYRNKKVTWESNLIIKTIKSCDVSLYSVHVQCTLQITNSYITSVVCLTKKIEFTEILWNFQNLCLNLPKYFPAYSSVFQKVTFPNFFPMTQLFTSHCFHARYLRKVVFGKFFLLAASTFGKFFLLAKTTFPFRQVLSASDFGKFLAETTFRKNFSCVTLP